MSRNIEIAPSGIYLSEGQNVYPAYFLPGVKESELEVRTEKFENKYGKLEVEIPRLKTSLIKNTLNALDYSRKGYLNDKSTSEILDIAYKNIKLWSDPNYRFREAAEKWMPISMGFSPEMSRKVLDETMASFTRDLYKIPLTEKNNGIEKIFCIPPEVPGPDVLSIIKGLLNKSSVFCKSSVGNVFSSLYAQSYLDVDKEIAGCIAVAPWKGGKLESVDVENLIYGERNKKDAIVIFGKPKTEEAIREKARHDTNIISYTRGISFGVIGKEMLTRDKIDDLALEAALAVCMADQRDCFSSQSYYVERGGEISPEEFSEMLAKKMQDLEFKMPRGELSLDASANFTEHMTSYELLDLTGNLKLYEIRRDKTQTGAVIYREDKEFQPSPLYRVITVKPVDDVSEVPKLVESFSEFLHTVGVALPENKKKGLGSELKKFGVSRITSINKMYKPSILEYELFA